MKEIKAIIQPHMLTKVMDALHTLPHFPGVTVSDSQGQGRGGGKSGQYVPDERTIYFSKKTKLELFCSDEICDRLVEVIKTAAHTGNPGDGIIMVVDLPRVVRIRTGEEQDRAV
jgi:nitrogen regulatory protein P-II 1